MTPKKHVILVVALVVVAGILLIMERNTNSPNSTMMAPVELLAQKDIRSIDSIKIDDGENTVHLTKNESNLWFIENDKNFPADVSKLVRMFDDLVKIKVVRVVSTDKAQFGTMGLDKPKRVSFESQGNVVKAWNFGERWDKGGQYMSNAREDQAILVDKYVTIGSSITDWESRQLVDIEDKDIKSITLSPKKSLKKKMVSFMREKPEDEFKLDGKDTKGEEIDVNLISNVKTALKNLNFTKRYDLDNEAAKNAMKSPSQAEFETFAGTRYQVKVGESGKEDAKKYFIQIFEMSGDKETESQLNELMKTWSFEVSSYIGQRFEKGHGDFIKKNS